MKSAAAIERLLRIKVALTMELISAVELISTIELVSTVELISSKELSVFALAYRTSGRASNEPADYSAGEGVVPLVADDASDDRTRNGSVACSTLSVALSLSN